MSLENCLLAELLEFEFQFILDELTGEIDGGWVIIVLNNKETHSQWIVTFGELDKLPLFLFKYFITSCAEVLMARELLH